MICDKCKKNQATTHVHTVVNGKQSEVWLCTECAHTVGYDNIFGGMASDFSSFLGNFLGDGLPARTSGSRCKNCGASFADIARLGKVGCANCYDVFYDELLPSIKKMHGNTKHMGKTASCAGAQVKTANRVEKLKAELLSAIKEQDFENAAKLRDQIKSLEDDVDTSKDEASNGGENND